MAKTLHGPEENKQFLEQGLVKLKEILPCSKKYAIAYLHYELGHCTNYVRTELIDTFLEVGFIKCDSNMQLSLNRFAKKKKIFSEKRKRDLKGKPANEETGELATDEKGNHIAEEVQNAST